MREAKQISASMDINDLITRCQVLLVLEVRNSTQHSFNGGHVRDTGVKPRTDAGHSLNGMTDPVHIQARLLHAFSRLEKSFTHFDTPSNAILFEVVPHYNFG